MSSLALLSGETDYIFDATAMTYVHAGKLRVLAVAYTKRWPTEPDVPSMAELGYPRISVEPFFALVAPAGTPREIVARLQAEVAKAVRVPDLNKRFLERGVELAASASPEEFAAHIQAEFVKKARLAREAGIRVE